MDNVAKLADFISSYISGPFEQGVGIIEDKLKYMRWTRKIRLMLRAQEFMNEIGLTAPTKKIQIKLLIQLLESASLEDDDELQDLWAKLLVNSAYIESGIDLKGIYIEILKRLTPLEAQILSTIYSLPFEHIQHVGALTSELPYKSSPATNENSVLNEPSEEIKLALASLSVTGCCSIQKTWGGGESFSKVNPTLLGREFVRACTLNVRKPE